MVEDGRGSGADGTGIQVSGGHGGTDGDGAASSDSTTARAGLGNGMDEPPYGQDINDELVRLLQCPNCSGAIRQPCTLPCGHSGCRDCLQTQHLSETGFLRGPSVSTCRCKQCGVKHSGMEYVVDVTLNKIAFTLLSGIKAQPRRQSHSTALDGQKRQVKRQSDPEKQISSDAMELDETSRGRSQNSQDVNNIEGLERLALDSRPPPELDLRTKYQRMVEKDLDCEICYGVVLDPVTTPCGHSFCRRCLVRVLDHAEACPVCRHAVNLPASAINRPTNVRLRSLVDALFSAKLTERSAAVRIEETGVPEGFDLPLFVCMLSYPATPTFLFIFEPRYRLMMRRVMAGSRMFGMVTSTNRVRAVSPTDTANPSGAAAAAAGFCEYGTALRIEHMELMPDGTSVVQSRGVSRFRIRHFDNQDGYLVGKVDPVEDVSMADERAFEARDMVAAQRAFERLSPDQQRNIQERGLVTTMGTTEFSPMTLLSNEELVRLGHDFVERMRSRGRAGFLNLPRDVLEAFGPPPHDAGTFSYWFAAVVNQTIPERERYRLLSAQTRRQRLLITSRWINHLDQQVATTGTPCRVF